MIFYSFLAVKPACVCEQFFGRYMQQPRRSIILRLLIARAAICGKIPMRRLPMGVTSGSCPVTSRTYKVLCGTFFEQGENPHGQHDEDTYTAANQPPIHPGIGI